MGVRVADYYHGKSVLIIGGSGFLGKVLLEKLLYSCSGIDNIYLLMRDSNGTDIQQRLNTLFEKPIFTRLKKENPLAVQKVHVLNGDLTVRNLGLSVEDENILIDKVSIVFHLAATVNFNDPIEVIFNINVYGTERILNLCKRMKNIQKFVYVSTAYSNADQSVIDEIVYPQPISLDAVKKQLIVGLSEKETKKLLNGKPNVYTFTKAMAEDYINENHEHVPAVIIRPSIVSASIKEPLEGWIDSWAGASSVIASVGVGLIRVILGKFSNIADLIPVDYVINLTIVAAANNHNVKEVSVYNVCTSELNPLTISMLNEYTVEHSLKNKIYKRPNPGIEMSTSKLKVQLTSIFQEILPIYLFDMRRHLKGDRKKYMNILKRFLFAQKVMEPFISQSWIIRAQRTRALAESLSDSDRVIFPCNPVDIVWSDYIHAYCNGIKKYLYRS